VWAKGFKEAGLLGREEETNRFSAEASVFPLSTDKPDTSDVEEGKELGRIGSEIDYPKRAQQIQLRLPVSASKASEDQATYQQTRTHHQEAALG
jgi:hypothetical protein